MMKDLFYPVLLRVALGKVILKSEPLGKFGEYPVVRLRLKKRGDAPMLVNNDTVIAGVGAVMGIAAGISPLSYIIALECGAGGKDNICQLRFGAPPAVLVNDEFKLGALVHFYVAISLGHRAQIRTAVAVEHFYFGTAGGGIGQGDELLFQRLPAESLSQPFDGRIQYRFRHEQSVDALLN